MTFVQRKVSTIKESPRFRYRALFRHTREPGSQPGGQKVYPQIVTHTHWFFRGCCSFHLCAQFACVFLPVGYAYKLPCSSVHASCSSWGYALMVFDSEWYWGMKWPFKFKVKDIYEVLRTARFELFLLAAQHHHFYPIWNKSNSPTCLAVRLYFCQSSVMQQLMQRWACQCIKGCRIRTNMKIMKIQQKRTTLTTSQNNSTHWTPLTASAQEDLFIAVVNARPMQGGGTPCRGWETLRLTRADCSTFSLSLSLRHVGHAWICGNPWESIGTCQIHGKGQPAVEILYEYVWNSMTWEHLINAWERRAGRLYVFCDLRIQYDTSFGMWLKHDKWNLYKPAWTTKTWWKKHGERTWWKNKSIPSLSLSRGRKTP